MDNTSSELREWAARCEDMAASAATESERASLLRKAEGLRALADSEDWLTGRQTDDSVAKCAEEMPMGLRSLAAE